MYYYYYYCEYYEYFFSILGILRVPMGLTGCQVAGGGTERNKEMWKVTSKWQYLVAEEQVTHNKQMEYGKDEEDFEFIY